MRSRMSAGITTWPFAEAFTTTSDVHVLALMFNASRVGLR
jgi:hypothetical protein